MTVTCVVGAQWGDEGKGKIIDFLTRDAQMVVRYQGGANAGHTVVVGGEEFILHLLPSGILHPGVRCVIGNGVVIDPQVLLDELAQLTRRGIDPSGRLSISDRAHVVFPYHRAMDRHHESARGPARLGTTVRGIGPAYGDKVRRVGIRIADLYDPEVLRERLSANVREKNAFLAADPEQPPIDFEALLHDVTVLAEAMRPWIADAIEMVYAAADRGEGILLEGAQGTLLDLDFGSYPFVTSSNASACGAAAGAGLPPRRIDRTIGVLKAYITRVGEGPMPTELPAPEAGRLRDRGGEYGATTGRPRRCGWLDVVAARFAARVNGLDEIALTKLDVLDAHEEIRVGVGYRIDGGTTDRFPASIASLQRAEPVYETIPGWTADTSRAERWEDLPAGARAYVERVEALVGVPVTMISVGRRRDQIVRRPRSGMAGD